MGFVKDFGWRWSQTCNRNLHNENVRVRNLLIIQEFDVPKMYGILVKKWHGLWGMGELWDLVSANGHASSGPWKKGNNRLLGLTPNLGSCDWIFLLIVPISGYDLATTLALWPVGPAQSAL